MGARVKASLLCMSAVVNSGCAPGKADQPPAGEVLVAAVDRVGEHAFHGVRAQVLKNACAVGQTNPVALPCSSAVITSSCCAAGRAAERLAVCALAVRIELREAAPIEFLLVRVGAGEREIDVVEHAGIGRARLARRAGHQPLGECLDGAAVVIVEERAVRRRSSAPSRSRRPSAMPAMLPAGASAAASLLAGFGERIGNQRDAVARRRLPLPCRQGMHGGLHHAFS